MKKMLTLVLALSLVLMVGLSMAEAATPITHADYVAAELDSAVTVETFVQDTQSWWDNAITVYAQSPDGAYFIYNMA